MKKKTIKKKVSVKKGPLKVKRVDDLSGLAARENGSSDDSDDCLSGKGHSECYDDDYVLLDKSLTDGVKTWGEWAQKRYDDEIRNVLDLAAKKEEHHKMKEAASSAQTVTKTVTKTSDPEWFESWTPKKSNVGSISYSARATAPEPDEVLEEFARVLENRPNSYMDALEQEVAAKTKEFLLAKRALLESKQKLALAYDKFIKTVELDKDPLIDELK